MSREIDALKKKALMTLELSPDTKTNVTNAEIATFVQKLKSFSSKKELIVIVTEMGKR